MKTPTIIPIFFTFLSLIFIIGCSQGTKVEQESAGFNLPVSNPASEGIKEEVLDSIHKDIENGKYGLVDHFLVIRNGKMVFDQKYDQDYATISQKYDTTNHQFNYDHPAWHPFYNNTNLHSLQSVTKSINSILMGIAIDEGLIDDVDSEIISSFSDYTLDITDPGKSSITLKNLLTMRSGIEWDEEAYDGTDDCTQMELSDDWIQYVLDKPIDTIPGEAFEYNSGASVLIGKLISINTNMGVDEWAEEKLFAPLGITDYYWKKTPLGETDTEGGLYLSSHDLAKIGLLMLNKGKWNGKQIVSQKWVEDSTVPLAKVDDQLGYGYQWWIPKHKNEKAEIFAGLGYGGQYLFVAPNYDLIVVFNGWNIHDQAEKSCWSAFEDLILPAMVD
ncbi:MAG: serine hydrolase [Saprospiraceae bacterium]|nr:serine hydrolase [Saprospiraceae bacterium]